MATAASEWQDKKTIGDMLNQTVARFGEREAWVFKDTRITYRELRDRVDRLAGGLIRLGVSKGDKVSLWMPNRLEWVYAYFAVAKIGAALVPVNTRFKAHEAAYLIGQSDSNTLIIADRFLKNDYLSMVRELCPELAHCAPGRLNAEKLPALRNVVCLADEPCDPRSPALDGMFTFDAVMALGNDFSAGQLVEVERSVNPDDVVLIMYTSGTTGFPKGVMHSHKIIRNMTDLGQRLGIREDDCLILFLPLFHVYAAFAGVILHTIYGARLVLMEGFDAGETLRLTEQEKATVTYGTDTTYFDQLRHPDFERYDLSSLRTGLVPTGPDNQVLMAQGVLAKMCKGARGNFGMTECTSVTAATFENDPPERTYFTSGYPLPGFEIKIADPSTSLPVPPNTLGEICCKGHPVTLGYYKKPEETAKAIDADGWFHTGDMGSVDEHGYVRFLGRYKDMLKVGGENTDPVEVEALLLQHPAVAMAKVTGVPDKRLTEVAAAFVQFKPGESASEQELIEYCRARLANFKVPRYVLIVDDYPMTASGKIQKFRLREMALERLDLHDLNG